MAAATFPSAREPVVGGPQPHRRLSSFLRHRDLKGLRHGRSSGARGPLIVAAWHHEHKPKRRTRPGLDADIYLMRLDSFGFAIPTIPKVQPNEDRRGQSRPSGIRRRAAASSA